MRINHNIASLNAYRNLTMNTVGTSKSLEKLSSGLRINRAADDAAGLAISEKMRGQIRGLTRASANSQDSISMIQTAEGALNETHAILQRIRELAVQASNDTNTDNDRDQLQNEIVQLKSEIDRISNQTEFNTKKLLNGTLAAARSATGSIVTSEAIQNISAETAATAATISGTAVGATVVLNSAATNGTQIASNTVTPGGIALKTQAIAQGLQGTATSAMLIMSGASANFRFSNKTLNFMLASAKDVSGNLQWVNIGVTFSGGVNANTLANVLGGINDAISNAGLDGLFSAAGWVSAGGEKIQIVAKNTGNSYAIKLDLPGTTSSLYSPANVEWFDAENTDMETNTAQTIGKSAASNGAFTFGSTDKLNFTINGTDNVVVNLGLNSGQTYLLADLVDQVNSAIGALSSKAIAVASTNGRFYLKTTEYGETKSIHLDVSVGAYAQGASGLFAGGLYASAGNVAQGSNFTSLKLAVDGTSGTINFTVDNSSGNITLANVVAAINADTTFGSLVSASISGGNKLMLVSKETGTTSTVKVMNADSYNGASRLGFSGGQIGVTKAGLDEVNYNQLKLVVGGTSGTITLTHSTNGIQSLTNIANQINNDATFGSLVSARVTDGNKLEIRTIATGVSTTIQIEDPAADTALARLGFTDGDSDTGTNEYYNTLLTSLQDADGLSFGLTSGDVINISLAVGGSNLASSLSVTATTTIDELMAKIAATAGLASSAVTINNNNTLQMNGSTGLSNAIAKISLSANGRTSFNNVMGAGTWQETQAAKDAKINNGSLIFHVGANEDQTISLAVNEMDVNNLLLTSVDISNQKGAEIAISVIDNAINSVSDERSSLGAVQNRLEHTINNLGVASENLTAAESRVRDVDMAKEMMEFTKFNILNQAATAMLAQANQQPQNVLQLLR